MVNFLIEDIKRLLQENSTETVGSVALSQYGTQIASIDGSSARQIGTGVSVNVKLALAAITPSTSQIWRTDKFSNVAFITGVDMPYSMMYFSVPLAADNYTPNVPLRTVQFRIKPGAQRTGVLQVRLQDETVILASDKVDACFTWSAVSKNPLHTGI
jgi:hypothetical protein